MRESKISDWRRLFPASFLFLALFFGAAILSFEFSVAAGATQSIQAPAL
jgi:hypothetical protein